MFDLNEDIIRFAMCIDTKYPGRSKYGGDLVFYIPFNIQYNLNGWNTDGSFTVDDSNSFFQSIQNSSNSSRKQIFRDFFLILSWNYMLSVLIRIVSSRQF